MIKVLASAQNVKELVKVFKSAGRVHGIRRKVAAGEWTELLFSGKSQGVLIFSG